MVEVLVAATAAVASTPAAISAAKTVSLALPIMNLLSTNGIHGCLRVTETSGSRSGPLVAPGEPLVATLVPGCAELLLASRSRAHGIRSADPRTDPGLRGRDMAAEAQS